MQNTVKELLQSSFVKNIEGDVLASFSGIMSQEVIVGFGEMLRSVLHQYHPLNIVNRTFAIYVEMSQNVLHYSKERFEEGGKSIGKGTVIILVQNEAYVLISVNLVNENQKAIVQKKIELINNMDREEIKDHYLKKRRELVEVDSKGAGLGFIDMVRRSEKPLNFEFIPAGNDKYLFFLSSTIFID